VQLTYPEAGATRGDELPAGYRHVRRHANLGRGQTVFQAAADALGHWRMHRAAGLAVRASAGEARVGVRSSGLGIGPLRIWAPCEVIWLVDEPDRYGYGYGYGYGTLPGHPESGEEAFIVSLVDGGVWFDIRAFSRPARWYTRLGRPVVDRLQDRATDRYAAALTRLGGARGRD
jgi:uncharacterized protein (UPF0548 family)